MTKNSSKKSHAPGLFFKEGLKKFGTNGSFVPSSKYLGKMILKHVDMKPKVIIVELGAGTGAFTNMILSKMPKDGRLIIFEINSTLAKHLCSSIIDPRAIVLEVDAVEMVRYLKKLNITNPDYIISGIPIGTMSAPDRGYLLQAINESLGDDGLFIQFQYFLASLIPLRRIFKTKIIGYEYRNIPPAFVYGCRKRVV
jgi:phospholipid N-methyltransferase